MKSNLNYAFQLFSFSAFQSFNARFWQYNAFPNVLRLYLH